MTGEAETTSLDIATAVVAGYAALVATLALAFNFFSWLRTWQTRVTVVLRRMNLLTPGTGRREPVVLFELTNHSGHRVKVTHVSLTPIARGGQHLLIPQPLGLAVPGPFEIQARDSVTVWISPDVLADGDPNHKTRTLIRTSDGAESRSKRVRVRALLEDDSER
jgi:hypothetical protein